MKYVFFALECYPFPIIKHLLDEGNEVIVAMLNSDSQLAIPGVNDEEKLKDKEQRLSIYDGIVKKNSLQNVLKYLSRMPQKEKDKHFVFFDFNNMYKISESILKMGFTNGLFPTEFYYKMEKERGTAKDFVKKHYSDIKVADSFDFSDAKEGIEFIQSSIDKMYVLKSNGNYGKTIVPKTEDSEIAKEILIEVLYKNGKDYERDGFLLEEKIPNCLEVTPVMVFYDGVPVYSLVEFESKEFGAGNVGVQKGGNICLNARTDLYCKINNISFPKKIYELAKKHTGLSIFDIGLLYNGKDFYFTEFCAMRYGWDGVFSEMVMSDEGKPFVGKYFESIISGCNPIVNSYGASVRVFNLNGEMESTGVPEDGLPVGWKKEVDNNFFPYRIRKKDKELVTVGGFDLLGVATGASDILETAVSKAYQVVDSVNFEKIYYRPKFDFLSMEYKSSILNRFSAIKQFLE